MDKVEDSINAAKSHKNLNLKYTVAISGAAETGHCSPDAMEKTEELGRLIAERGMILVTGATTGAP